MANELKCWPSIVEKFNRLQFEWTRGSITKISKSVLNRGAEGERHTCLPIKNATYSYGQDRHSP